MPTTTLQVAAALLVSSTNTPASNTTRLWGQFGLAFLGICILQSFVVFPGMDFGQGFSFCLGPLGPSPGCTSLEPLRFFLLRFYAWALTNSNIPLEIDL